jgi:hypothetical protein
MIHKLIAVGLLSLLSMGDAHADDTVSPVVVELFTSQGCSSCPPADIVLSTLAQRPDVLALSFHVDYWDNLGWKDPFASPLNTARQNAYRVSFHNSQIYTPQMVIDGVAEMVGSRASAVTAAIADVAQRHRPGPGLTINRAGAVTVTVTAGNAPAATIWVAAYNPHHKTAVRRGENAGSDLVNTNVVRKLVALGSYSGGAASFVVPLDFARDDEGVAAWLQVDPTGAILSAANAPPRS